ncbi:hypothetical protein PMIN04_013250 [Paraphaeosphaeria minitans]
MGQLNIAPNRMRRRRSSGHKTHHSGTRRLIARWLDRCNHRNLLFSRTESMLLSRAACRVKIGLTDGSMMTSQEIRRHSGSSNPAIREADVATPSHEQADGWICDHVGAQIRLPLQYRDTVAET